MTCNLCEYLEFPENTMTSKRFTLNFKVISISIVAILALITFSTFLVKVVQENNERRSTAVSDQNRVTRLITSIRADVAESLLPVHSYVISPDPMHKKKFDLFSERIEQNLETLKTSEHFEPIDLRLVTEAISHFKQLERVQEKIFKLKREDIVELGPAQIKKLDRYQDALLTELHKLQNLEEAELANFLSIEQTTGRRSFILIALAAVMALIGALVVGYIGSRV